MANGQITEVVSKEAYSQIEKLLNGLDDITNRVNKINANSLLYSSLLSIAYCFLLFLMASILALACFFRDMNRYSERSSFTFDISNTFMILTSSS